MIATVTIPVPASTGPNPALVAALAELEEAYPSELVVADALVVTAMTPRAREALAPVLASLTADPSKGQS